MQWGAATCSSLKRYDAKRRCGRTMLSLPSPWHVSAPCCFQRPKPASKTAAIPSKSHGLDLTCQHTAAAQCRWVHLRDVKRAHGLHGTRIARIARTARSCTDLHGVARTARTARIARTAQTARTARTVHGLHGLHGQHGLCGANMSLDPLPPPHIIGFTPNSRNPPSCHRLFHFDLTVRYTS